MHDLAGDLRDNHVKTLAAYNIPFDYRAVHSSAKFFGVLESKDIQYILSRNMLDIWKMAKDTICQEVGYLNFINNEPNGYTAKGNMKTTAELVYKYIIGKDFEEKHTALADAQIEAHILNYLMRHYKGVAQYYIPRDRKEDSK